MSETDANGGTETVREVGIVDGVVIDIDLTEPHREMREETSTFFSMSAARDERMLILDHEKLDPASPLSAFAKAATVRYAPAHTFAVAGVAAS